jgi:hypothetical protein
MISERLEAARKRLAATGNARVYTVRKYSPTRVVVLMVPRGCEHLDTSNLDGGPPPDDSAGDWGHGQIAAPTLIELDESVLPPEPRTTLTLRDASRWPAGRITKNGEKA